MKKFLEQKIKTVDEYITFQSAEGKEWTIEFVDYMRRKAKEYPKIKEEISYQIPSFAMGDTYIAFASTEDHFTVHTLEYDLVEKLKHELPQVLTGKGSVKIKYGDAEIKAQIYKLLDDIIERVFSK